MSDKFCSMCFRSESTAGKMVDLPGNMHVCSDCMQKTMDTMSSFGMPFNGQMPTNPWKDNVGAVDDAEDQDG